MEQPDPGTAVAALPPSQPEPEGDFLRVEDLNAAYGKKQVVYDVNLHVGRGEGVAILGHNGAGKTTTLKCIFGMVPPRSGRIVFDGKDITHGSTVDSVHQGMSFIPAERFVFQDMSVIDNLRLGALTVRSATARQERFEVIYQMFPILRERTGQAAGTLSGGQQRMVSLAMALMSNPRLLLLDEPSLGLAPALIQQFTDRVKALVNERGMSVVLLEQNVGSALRLADRVYVMRSGRIILEETTEAMLAMRREKWWELF